MGKVPFRETQVQLLHRLNPTPPSSLPQTIRSIIPHTSPKNPTSANENNASSPPSPIIFNSPNLSDAKSLFSSFISSRKINPSDPSLCNSILKSFASVSTVQDSIFFLNHMVRTHPTFSPNRSTYHTLLAEACSSPDQLSLAPAYSVLSFMSENGVPPDKVSVDVAVRALCGCGREEHAIELVKELVAKNVVLDGRTYHFMVKHFVKNLSLDTVNMFVIDMRRFGIKPDLVTYTIMIDNVCNSKNLREAMRLLRMMREDGFKPDCYVYNTIAKGYCMLDQGSRVMEVYEKMLKEGVKPDRYTFNTLIYGLARTGKVKEAMTYLETMVEMGHSPNEVTYASLMTGLCKEGRALQGLDLLKEMEAKGCTPNSSTFNTLLHGLSKAGLFDKGFELYGVMKRGGVKLESGSYGSLLRALCRAGKVAEAYEVFDYAVESKSLRDVVAYSTLDTMIKWLTKARAEGLKV